MDNASLSHYGIKGMKWGVRRYQNKDGSLTLAGKIRAKRLQNAIDANDRDVADLKKYGYTAEAKAVKAVGDRNRQKLAELYERGKSINDMSDAEEKKTRKADVKNRRIMSDSEIKKRIERLKLEREYKSLVDSDISRGKKFVSEVISDSGKKVLTIAAAGTIAYAVKAAMTGKFDLKEAAQYIAANPNRKK